MGGLVQLSKQIGIRWEWRSGKMYCSRVKNIKMVESRRGIGWWHLSSWLYNCLGVVGINVPKFAKKYTIIWLKFA